MSEISNRSLSKHVYSAREGAALFTQVTGVICVLLPRGLLAGGFNDQGEIISIRYSDYKKDLPTWNLDFYEHQFINDPLLINFEKVFAVFIGSDKSTIFPEDLYDEKIAAKWMHQLFFVETNELIFTQILKEDHATYISVWPASIRSLTLRYFDKAKVFPFASFQFNKSKQADCLLQCCITSDLIYATLYYNNGIEWHQIFNYETAEDIAYQIKLLCQLKNIDEERLMMQVTVSNKSLTYVTNQLALFFPALRDTDAETKISDKAWTGTAYLLQQLYSCAL